MRRKFYKMHGIGNDYVYFNCMHKPFPYPERLAIKLSDRHFSIGSDGIILILPSKVATAKMRIFNADGSEGKTCGNGLRCVAKFLYDFGYAKEERFTIETQSGITPVKVYKDLSGKVTRATVNMGLPTFLNSDMGGGKDKNSLPEYVTLNGVKYSLTCVSVGNLHAVLFGNIPVDVVGAAAKLQPLLPFQDGVNTEFAEIVSQNEIRMRVVERGSGETLACGSGAVAVVATAVKNGLARSDEDVYLHLKGGTLTVKVTKSGILLSGACETAFEGVVEIT